MRFHVQPPFRSATMPIQSLQRTPRWPRRAPHLQPPPHRNQPRSSGPLEPLKLTTALPTKDLPAYVLFDLLDEMHTMDPGDEAELSWQIVTPVIDAWSANAASGADLREAYGP